MKPHRIDLHEGDLTQHEFQGNFFPRSAIIGRVERGEITPDEAEREAISRGCGPLRVEPDSSAFDPMAVARWTLPMALAWIRWREPSQVSEWDNRYRPERRGWAPLILVIKDGSGGGTVTNNYTLAQEEAASCELIRETLMRDAPPTPPSARKRPTAAAEKELWSNLADGHIKAHGSRASDGKMNPMPIPAHEWARLAARTTAGPCRVDDSADYLAFEDRPSEPIYVHVDLSREEVVQRWQSAGASGDRTIGGGPNVPLHGAKPSSWAKMPEVERVAVARLLAAGTASPEAVAIGREMYLMLQEQDAATVTKESVVSAYRTGLRERRSA